MVGTEKLLILKKGKACSISGEDKTEAAIRSPPGCFRSQDGGGLKEAEPRGLGTSHGGSQRRGLCWTSRIDTANMQLQGIPGAEKAGENKKT